MDSLIAAAARALARGHPLEALNYVAVRDEAPALALRGIAMAQLGDLDAARALLKKAARAFGPGAPVPRARCVVAQAEIAFVSRDLGWPVEALAAARAILAERGDFVNAAHAGHLQARRCLLLGHPADAEHILEGLDAKRLPPARATAHHMIAAGIAMRRLRTDAAGAAISQARRTAQSAGIPALIAEVEAAALLLDEPTARQISPDGERPLRLADVEALFRSDALVVDACRYAIRKAPVVVPLRSRPVLFTLARTLAQAWPSDVPRAELIRDAFGGRGADESHRARLRVEMGRLRRLLGGLAEVRATPRGFLLQPRGSGKVVVLAWPVEDDHAAVLALLSDGEAWASSAVALALGVSQRTAQRSLDALVATGRVQWFGRGRARRWTTTALPRLATQLLLTSPFAAELP